MSPSPARAWRRIPIDDLGYVSPAELLKRSDRHIRRLAKTFEQTRYGGWRNEGNRWRTAMGLDTTFGKKVIDYGCGFGIEALQLARHNAVILADLNESTLDLATRVLRLHGYDAKRLLVTSPEQKLPEADIFYAAGSLHHVPEARAVLERAYERCSEARLLLYSDIVWRAKMQSAPPQNTAQHKSFHGWLRAMDEVGEYADWYDEDKVKGLNEGLFDSVETSYAGACNFFLTARLS